MVQKTLCDSCVIEDADGEKLVGYGYHTNPLKIFLFYLLALCSGGFLFLVCYWKPEWELKLKCSSCLLHKANYVLLRTHHMTWRVERVVLKNLEEVNTYGRFSKLNFEEDNMYKSADLEKQTVHTKEYIKLLTHCDESKAIQRMRYFVHRHLKYVWNADDESFMLLRALDHNTSVKKIYGHAPGLPSADAQSRLDIYGYNMIDVKVTSYGRLFFEQALNPFYVFQLGSVILWCFDEYYYYASAIFIMSMGSILITIKQVRQHLVTLRDMVAQSDVVTVLRNKGGSIESEDIMSTDVVPGDVIHIPPQGAMMHCDAVLLSGNCIVNESMLTGESVPVTKTPLPHHAPSPDTQDTKEEIYSPKLHKRHTLYNGTRVIQTRYYGNAKVLAVVIRTGFYTTKGSLIRSILNPRPVGFKFFRDSMRFIGIMCALALCGFAYSVYIFIQQGATPGTIMKKALDVITIVVPPALPAAMAVGTVFALRRLKNHKIYCIDPQRINMSGKLKLFCFDKTGTLTEDGLDLLGAVPVEDARFEMIIKDVSTLPRAPLVAAMATCHTLTIIDGELTGDPLDIKMFEATEWIIDEPGEDTKKFENIAPTTVKPKIADITTVDPVTEEKLPHEIGIVRQFPFSSDIQRMSVITRTLGDNHMDVYVKGAPETVASLCRPESVPSNFQEELNFYTQQGYRVIGVAWRAMESKFSWHQAQRVKRDVVECDLTFMGMLVMQNALKPESTPIIRGLQDANVRTVMVTGDNMLTAVSVARECGMVYNHEKVLFVEAITDQETNKAKLQWSVEGKVNRNSSTVSIDIPERHRPYHIAVSGKTFAYIRENDPDLLKKLLVCGTVFARMAPEQKTHLVEELQTLGYCVGMCGDGANDCGALKTAHAGISLSEAEASIASPFTSKVPNIECVPKVIKEGRCALVTSFACFKFMAMYSIVQFVSVLILYSIGSNLSDFQFLYIDLIIITSLALVMGNQQPYPILVSRRPGGSLVAPIVLFSLFSQMIIQITVQVAGFYYVKQQSWYVPVNTSTLHQGSQDVQLECHDNTVLFTLSSFQYILLAIAFARGKPYRMPIYKNVWFLAVLIVLYGFTLFLVLFGKENGVHKLFELLILPSMNYRLILIGISCLNCVASLFVEECLVPAKCTGKLLNRLRCKKHPKNLYKVIQRDIDDSLHWPPVTIS